MWRNYLAILVAAGLFVGCGNNEDFKEGVSDADRDAAAHDEAHSDDHAHTAPHGGHLIELGDHQYNLEVTFDADKTLTLYVLDAHAENPVAIAPGDIEFELEHGDDEVEIELTPMPLEGETAEKASVYVAKGNEHLAELEDIEALHGHAHVTIDGEEFLGELEHDHEGEDGHAEHGDHGDHKEGDKHDEDGEKDE